MRENSAGQKKRPYTYNTHHTLPRTKWKHQLSIRNVLAILTCISIISQFSCTGKEERDKRYAAEKALFNARKIRNELFSGMMRPEFLERTLESYRFVVNEYKDSVEEVQGLKDIVVSAQLELAEVEFRAGKFVNARKDFEIALILADRIPKAQANALFSAAFVSEQMKDVPKAIELYERFFNTFLIQDSLRVMAKINAQYLTIPLRLFELSRDANLREDAEKWLGKAETTFLYMIENEENEKILRNMKFNLLTTYLQGENWRKALAMIQELKNSLTTPDERSMLFYLEARLFQNGMNEPEKALSLFVRAYEENPESMNALSALLTAGSIHFKANRYEEAERLFKKIVEEYSGKYAAVVEAKWQLARIAEERGNWVDASLSYKQIYTEYPGTLRGFEAPLRIAGHFKDRGEREAAQSAFQRAIDHYERLITTEVNIGTRIMAEEYIVRTYAEQEQWRETANRLLMLPQKYPDYARFRQNYLMAASIYERELGENVRAAEVLEECMGKYPGTAVAREAERHFKRLKGLD